MRAVVKLVVIVMLSAAIAACGGGGNSGVTTSSNSPTVTAIAGSPNARGTQADGTGTSALFWGDGHLALDGAGNLIASDHGSLRKVTADGNVTTIASGTFFFSIAVSPVGDIFGSPYMIGATSSYPNFTYAATLPVLTASGSIEDVYATWTPESTSAIPRLNGEMVTDSNGNFYFADERGNRILKIRPGIDMTVFAGSGAAAYNDGVGTAASFRGPTSLAVDVAGNVIVNDIGNGAIRKISPDGSVSTIITIVQLTSMGRHIAVDGDGNIFVDAFPNIKRIDDHGNVTSFPLDGVVDPIYDMVADHSGNLYLSTSGIGAQVWRVSF
jgi:hypothetical protein